MLTAGWLVHAGNAPASVIHWSDVFTIDQSSGVEDLVAGGEIVLALNIGEDGPSGDVSVTNSRETILFNGDVLMMPRSNADHTGFGGNGFYDYPTGNAGLDYIFDSHGWKNKQPPTYEFEIGPLTAGEEYIVQFIAAADTRGCCGDRTQTVQDDQRPPNVSGTMTRNGASSVFGTFTADADTERITLEGYPKDPGFSLILLREAHELDYVWDGNGNGNWTDHRWGVGPVFPTSGHVSVGTDVVSVTDHQAAESLEITGGTVDVVGTGTTLTLESNVQIEDTGTLIVGPGGLLAAPMLTSEGTVGGSGRIGGQFENAGLISPGPGAASLTVGDVDFTETAEYVWQTGITAADLIRIDGNADSRLGGRLTLQAIGVGPADVGRSVTRPVMEVVGEGPMVGEFASVPPTWSAGDPAPSHIGMGVFHRGTTYATAIPPTFPPSHLSVDAELYYAEAGDLNGDETIDDDDLNRHVENHGGNVDYSWSDGDTRGFATGRAGDGVCDGIDLNALIANRDVTGDPGPLEASASAVYNPATGEFVVSAQGVMSWVIMSDGLMTGPDSVADALQPDPFSDLLTDSIHAVGEANLQDGLSYDDVHLGRIAATGREPTEFVLEYTAGWGQPMQSAAIGVVPEPATWALMLTGAAALAAYTTRRQRRRRRFPRP